MIDRACHFHENSVWLCEYCCFFIQHDGKNVLYFWSSNNWIDQSIRQERRSRKWLRPNYPKSKKHETIHLLCENMLDISLSFQSFWITDKSANNSSWCTVLIGIGFSCLIVRDVWEFIFWNIAAPKSYENKQMLD